MTMKERLQFTRMTGDLIRAMVGYGTPIIAAVDGICAVVAKPDEERGEIVQAHVVLGQGLAADAVMIKTLQDHVKAKIAPYEYPRSIVFMDSLPKTQTGKIQRFRLKGTA